MVFDVAKGYRRTEPAAWLCCWSAEPVASWLVGSSGLKRFSQRLLGLTPDLGTTTKEMSNNGSRDILLLSTRHKWLKICWCFLIRFCLVCETEQTAWRKVLVAMVTSLSSSGGSWSRLSSLLRLCLWLWWKRKKSEVLFFRRYRTRPRAGTEEYTIGGRVDDSSKKYQNNETQLIVKIIITEQSHMIKSWVCPFCSLYSNENIFSLPLNFALLLCAVCVRANAWCKKLGQGHTRPTIWEGLPYSMDTIRLTCTSSIPASWLAWWWAEKADAELCLVWALQQECLAVLH